MFFNYMLATAYLSTLAVGLPSPITFTPSFDSASARLGFQSDQTSQQSSNTLADPFKVEVVLGVMSACPDARICEDVWDQVLDRVGTLVDISTTYIGHLNPDAKYGVECMHGEHECLGNIQQLCATKYFKGIDGSVNPWANAWNFIQCQNYNGLSKMGNENVARSCAKLANHDYSDIEECIKGGEGEKLLQESVKTTATLGITKSCSIVVSGKLVCIHDGRWKDCPVGHEPGDFAAEVRKEWNRLNSV